MNIPTQYQITKLLHQKTYLINGELKTWDGKTTEVYSTISSTDNYQPTLLGSIPYMEKESAMEALLSACDAYDKGPLPRAH